MGLRDSGDGGTRIDRLQSSLHRLSIHEQANPGKRPRPVDEYSASSSAPGAALGSAGRSHTNTGPSAALMVRSRSGSPGRDSARDVRCAAALSPLRKAGQASGRAPPRYPSRIFTLAPGASVFPADGFWLFTLPVV
jgi:hypothetical protein